MTESGFGRTSGLYIDVENLGNDSAVPLIDELLVNWPDSAPAPTKISLYVKGDTTALWRAKFSGNADFVVSVKGVQHVNAQGSKNSADIAIAIDAIADFVRGSVNYVAIFSDDSDFMILIDKIIEISQGEKNLPYLWILTNREGNKSRKIKEFIPEKYLHYVNKPPTVPKPKSEDTLKVSASTPNNTDNPILERMAVCIIIELPMGKFRIAPCQSIIERDFPKHPMANADGPKFGSWFANDIWPILKKRGVKLTKDKAPRTYEMTQAAKDSIKPVS